LDGDGIVESSGKNKSDRDPFWFEIYDRKPRIEKSILYLDDTPGLGVEFNQRALTRYGTKIL
jgi:L-alanine-DL-glutamate epimerase-like enolase superfamily enzyme